jgi:hypothetical protein
VAPIAAALLFLCAALSSLMNCHLIRFCQENACE